MMTKFKKVLVAILASIIVFSCGAVAPAYAGMLYGNKDNRSD